MGIKVSFKEPDLRDTARRVGRALVATMKRSITQKKSLSGAPAAPNAPATVRRKGKDHRMMDTGHYYRRALTVSARKKGLLIDLNTAKHPSGPTYEEIGEFNQLGHPNENKRSANHEHFGVTELDAKWALDQFEAELWGQLEKGIKITGQIKMVL